MTFSLAISTKYSYLVVKDFLEISNLDPIKVVEDVKKYKPCTFHIGIANQLLLKMILAFDINPKGSLKEAIQELNEYLLSVDKTDIEVINDAQIKVRFNTLTKEDKNKIREVLKRNRENDIKFGCSVILKNIDDAEYYLKQLDESRLKELKEMPIYKLFEKEINNG